ncbi:MAG: arginase [Halobacteria archaeon]|nr:arginase [Halobacteria archaeon]
MDIRIIGVPTDFGANRRGVDMGPSAIRYAGLADEIEATGVGCEDMGDIDVPNVERVDKHEDSDAKYLNEIEEVCSRLRDEIARTIDDGYLPLVLGGDHSLAIGTLGGSATVPLGVLWFDAHGDFNTPETTPSGNVHGMSLAASLGKGSFADMDWATAPEVREENVAVIGTRSLDADEKDNIDDSDVTVFTISDIDRRGMGDVIDEALGIATDGVDEFHVSLDIDWLDPNEAPGVGTPVHGGVTYREAHLALETVAEEGGMRSMDVVEVNPIFDERNKTAALATELVASTLGKRII